MALHIVQHGDFALGVTFSTAELAAEVAASIPGATSRPIAD